LDEGVFTATYKFALLQSLADLSVERTAAEDGSLRLSLDDIAEKFIQYYWRQALPYREADGIIRQNTKGQAAVVNRVSEARQRFDGKLFKAKLHGKEWGSLKGEVSKVIMEMPLWKLQVVAGRPLEFLYRRSEFRDRSIRLLPDAVAGFRDLYGIVTNFVRGAWIAQIQKIGFNQTLLGDGARLSEFLFGSERESLRRYTRILKAHQHSRCFYCAVEAKSGELDHFIPWSRYPLDLGHNFVYAHARCNGRKSDFLAHPDHLAKWVESNIRNQEGLADEFSAYLLPHDADRSFHVARWAYEQGEAAGSHVWVKDKEFQLLGPAWRTALNGGM